jgi:hypothetical protein
LDDTALSIDIPASIDRMLDMGKSKLAELPE